MIGFAQVILGSGEAVTCTSCYPHREPTMRPAKEVLDDIAGLVASWPCGPGPNLAFVGAEPFAHPQLPQLVQAAAESGCERIRLRTDGGALAVSGNAVGAFQAGVRHVEVVLLGGESATHDKLSGRPGLFDAAVAGIGGFTAAARAAGEAVAVTGYLPVCRHSAPHLSAMLLTLASVGAVSALVEPVSGFELTPAGAAEALRTATLARIAIHGPGVSPFRSGPWAVSSSVAAS
jgi:hypothetical protein